MKKSLLILLLPCLTLFAQPVKEVKTTNFPNGKVQTEGEYLNGQLDGYFKEFYPTGVLWKEWTFVTGIEHGISNWFFFFFFLNRTWNYK